MLRLGLETADRVVAALPSRVAYALADLCGDAWYRFAPQRRRLVAANLARVCEATGRPTRGRPFRDLLRAAFRNHARYYVELLRAPHYRADRIDEVVSVRDWDTLGPLLQAGAGIIATAHLGNFEPFGVFVVEHGIYPLCPIEEIRPPELFAFLAAHRGGGKVELVPMSRAARAVSARLRAGGTVGIIGDRDLRGNGHPVRMFGHPTTVPLGPAALAIAHGATLIVGRCLRVGPDRFVVDAEVLERPSSGDRRGDAAMLADRVAACFERHIGEAPEQWWGAFQRFWPDLPAADPA